MSEPTGNDPAKVTPTPAEDDSADSPIPARAAKSDRRPTRISNLHTGLVLSAVVLVLLVVFLIQNSRTVKISFFGGNVHVSLAIALLIAAIGGALIVGGAGAARIAQLRRRRHRERSRKS
jgi:uncharacterized integral membrane protein